jgi:hypothetical protein
MSTHVDHAETEVEVHDDAAGSGGGGGVEQPVSWKELDRLRAAHARLGRDLRRTRAEGFDD